MDFPPSSPSALKKHFTSQEDGNGDLKICYPSATRGKNTPAAPSWEQLPSLIRLTGPGVPFEIAAAAGDCLASKLSKLSSEWRVMSTVLR